MNKRSIRAGDICKAISEEGRGKCSGKSSRSRVEPAFERRFHFTEDTGIEPSWRFANKFGKFHRLDALDVNIALFPQPRHPGQDDLVRRVLKLGRDQDDTGEREPGVGSGRQHQGIAWFRH